MRLLMSPLRVLGLCAVLLAGLGLVLGVPHPTAAACLRIGGTAGGDFGFAANVGASADLIVVARVVALGDEHGTLKVLRVLKGSAGNQLDATLEALNDSCTQRRPVQVGDRVIYVEGSAADEAPSDFAFLRARGGGWQHGFNWYESLDALIARMKLLPDSATGAGGPSDPPPLPLLPLMLAASGGVALSWAAAGWRWPSGRRRAPSINP